MIVDGLIAWLKGLVLWILDLFPSAESLGSADWSSYLGSANFFVNMPLLMSLIGIFLAYEGVVLVVRLVLWLRHTLLP